jgi:hypothetical protein
MAEVQKIMAKRVVRAPSGSKQRVVIGEPPKEREWKLSGRVVAQHFTADPTKPTSFQGFHAKRLMVIIDEAAGVDPRIIEAASTLVTSADAKFILLGNPTGPGLFERAFDPRSGYKTVNASCFGHPNVLAGKDLFPGAVTRQWISDRWEDHGDGEPIMWPEGAVENWEGWEEAGRLFNYDDPWWQGHVLSIFPRGGVDTLIPKKWVLDALQLDFGGEGKHALGVDVARYGKDNTTLCVSAQRDILHMESHAKTSGPQAVKLVRDMAKDFGVDPRNVNIDATGIGGMGVVDWLQAIGIKSRLSKNEVNFWEYCNGVEFGASANNPERFVNRKAEIMWMLRARFQHQTLGLKRLPRRIKEILLNQLPEIKYRLTTKGQYAIEGKDEYRKLHGKSPDESEALALAVCRGIEEADDVAKKEVDDMSKEDIAKVAESLGLSVVEPGGNKTKLSQQHPFFADEEDIAVDYETLLDMYETMPESTLDDD